MPNDNDLFVPDLDIQPVPMPDLEEDFGGDEAAMPGEAEGEVYVSKFKVKKAQYNSYAAANDMEYPDSKTQAPSQLSRSVLYARARKVEKPKNPQINNDTQCLHCGCRHSNHDMHPRSERLRGHPVDTVNCNRCGNCPGGFLYQEQVNRVLFTEFLRWARRWLKAGKKRTAARFGDIWARTRNTGQLFYCAGCDTSIWANGMRNVVSRQEGLACASCSQCSTCCTCTSCEQCKRRKRKQNICKVCKVCDHCCQCASCAVCGRDASHNYCGYAFTDAMKRHDKGCGKCYKCCDCGDLRKVPFGSFAKPIFHKPSFRHHIINPSSRYIATEIEVAAITGYGMPIYETARKWGGATVGDGSLTVKGFEINSAPAGGDLYAQQVEDLCAAISKQGGYVDNKCGLHVHVDARDMNYYDIRRFVRVYAAIEDAVFAMVSPSRIDGYTDNDGKLHQYCQPCGKKYVASIEEGRLPYDKIKSDVITSVYAGPSTHVGGVNLRHRKRGQNIPRYNALNLHSWFYRGTIEARMFDGSINPKEIIPWGIMWALIADYVVKSTDEQAAKDMTGRPLACLKKIIGDNKNIIDFIRARVLMFGNGQSQRDARELF